MLHSIFLKGFYKLLYSVSFMRVFMKPGWQLRPSKEILMRAASDASTPSLLSPHLPGVNLSKVFPVTQTTSWILQQLVYSMKLNVTYVLISVKISNLILRK